MSKKYYDTINLEKYFGYRSASKLLAERATYRRVNTCHTIGLARLNRAWERDRKTLEKTLQRLAREDIPPGERLQLEARARKLARRMARYKEKARLLAARQGIFLDV